MTQPEQAARSARPSPEAEDVYKRWIAHIDDELTRHRDPVLRNELVRDQLHQIFLGRPHGGKLNFTLTTELPGNVLQLSLDPGNAVLETSFEQDLDWELYAGRKPLIWFWQMFDRSPVGLNQWLGLRFRCMLARHIFRSVGRNVRIFHGVTFRFGYNLTIEDDVTVRKFAILDDAQPLRLESGTVVDRYQVVGGRRSDLPNLDRFDETFIAIPAHPLLTDEDVERVIASIRSGW
jgi:hypothetical protein